MAGNSKVKDETEVQKLVRLTNMRVNKALTAIRGLSNLGKYQPTTAQRDKVFTALQGEMQKAHKAWTEQKAPAPTGFAL